MGAGASTCKKGQSNLAAHLQQLGVLPDEHVLKADVICDELTKTDSRPLLEGHLHQRGISIEPAVLDKLWELRERIAAGEEDFFQCRHNFLNNWEGVYHCMHCGYRLTQESDADRIAAEQAAEIATLVDVIPDGMQSGELSRQRGVSVQFLLDFTKRFDCWKATSWDIIRVVVKSATAATRCRYTELPEIAPFVGPAETFISYAQAGTWGDLVAAVLDGALDLQRYVWIDIFAVRQWPSSNPDLDFASTIRQCRSFLVVCSAVDEIKSMSYFDAFNRNAKALPDGVRRQVSFLRVWCLVEVHAAAELQASQEMPIVFKGGSHVLELNGSVRFEPTWKMLDRLCLLVDINLAEATVASDKARIMAGIETGVGIRRLNDIVRGVLAGARGLSLLADAAALVGCAACGDSGALKAILDEPSRYIHAMASGGYLNLLKKVVGKELDLNAKSVNGLTPLIGACQGGHEACARVLINAGADLHVKNAEGNTALILAALGGFPECVKLLLASGADPNETHGDGKPVLCFAYESGNTASVEALIRGGANVRVSLEDTHTPLLTIVSMGFVDIIKLLLQLAPAAVDVSAISPTDGSQALLVAAQTGCIECIHTLVAAGADVNARNHMGRTALMEAAHNGCVGAMDVLLQYEAAFELKDEFGCTALSFLRTKRRRLAEKGSTGTSLYLRCRPAAHKEEDTDARGRGIIISDDGMTCSYTTNAKIRSFQFHRAFPEASSQADLFAGLRGNELVEDFVDGMNVSVLLYGIAGSGKLYTAVGNESAPGFVPRVATEVFRRIDTNHTFKVSSYCLQLYNDTIIDLHWLVDHCTEGDDQPAAPTVKIAHDNDSNVTVVGAISKSSASAEELMQHFTAANSHPARPNRKRSHTLFWIQLETINKITRVTTTSKFHTVILAGCERVHKTGCGEQLLKEGKSINKSISALGDTISALTLKARYVPYRNSVITRLLYDSLGRGEHVRSAMIIHVSAAAGDGEENACSIAFGQRLGVSNVDDPIKTEHQVELDNMISRLVILEKDITDHHCVEVT